MGTKISVFTWFQKYLLSDKLPLNIVCRYLIFSLIFSASWVDKLSLSKYLTLLALHLLLYFKVNGYCYMLKGIVSRDLHICFLVSIDIHLKFLHLMEPLVCFEISFSSRIFLFSRLGVVSLPCEWSRAIRLSAAPVVLGAHYGAHANVV
jgi:hypothetical protein